MHVHVLLLWCKVHMFQASHILILRRLIPIVHWLCIENVFYKNVLYPQSFPSSSCRFFDYLSWSTDDMNLTVKVIENGN